MSDSRVRGDSPIRHARFERQLVCAARLQQALAARLVTSVLHKRASCLITPCSDNSAAGYDDYGGYGDGGDEYSASALTTSAANKMNERTR